MLVFMHHPPFSNSTETGDDSVIQTDLVPLILKARKTLALVTGHVHSYERFALGSEKSLIISGGGGGPRVGLGLGVDARHADLFKGPAIRPFHYLLLALRPDGVFVTAMGFQKDASEVPAAFDSFLLRY